MWWHLSQVVLPVELVSSGLGVVQGSLPEDPLSCSPQPCIAAALLVGSPPPMFKALLLRILCTWQVPLRLFGTRPGPPLAARWWTPPPLGEPKSIPLDLPQGDGWSPQIMRQAKMVLTQWVKGLAYVCSVTSDSLGPHRLQTASLLSPWNFPGKNIGAGCHFALQGIFLT